MPGRWLTSDVDGIRNDVRRILTAYNIPPQLPTAPGSGTGLRVGTPDFWR
jgi:hypothetical protein